MMPRSTQDQGYNGPAWSITDVRDVSIFTRDSGVIQGKRVTFKLFNGKQSFVDIPLDEFNSDTVNSKVDDAASSITDVLGLQGPIINIPPAMQS